MKKLLAIIIVAIMLMMVLASCDIISQILPQQPTPTPSTHKCEQICPECGKCLDSECTEDVCSNKCEGHKPPHACESICDDCGKCTDAECKEAACASKCEGHEPPHACESICNDCGKCTDAECTEEVCANKCPGHYVLTIGETTIEVDGGAQIGELPAVPEVEGKKNGKWMIGDVELTAETVYSFGENKEAVAVYEDVYYSVTLNYGSNSIAVDVKHGDKLSADALAIDSKYPFEVLEWKNGEETFDPETEVKSEMTLTAVLASYKLFETPEAWKNTGSTTNTEIVDETNPENTILQFVTVANYNGIYSQNLDLHEDFTDVRYIYLKVRASANAKITLRFFKENNAFSSTYMQSGQEITANGKWHIVCVDLDSLTTFSKEEIKLMLIMSTAAATVEIDDIYFAREEIEIELPEEEPEEKPADGSLLTYDFNNKEGWYFSGSATSMAISTDDNGNGILSGTIASWGSMYVKDLSNLDDLNYVYVKVKTSTELQLRLYGGDNMNVSPRRSLTGASVGTTADGYTVLRFDLTDWASINPTNGDFDKADIQMFALVRNASGSAIYDVDKIVLASEELSFE